MADVTILFTDIKDSTVIAAALGDATYGTQMRDPHFAVLRKVISEHHGQVFQEKGDGLIAYFPTAADAVIASVILQTNFHMRPHMTEDNNGQLHQIQVRMGLHTGAATPDGKPSFNALNYAARIEALADADQIILSDATYQQFDPPPYPCLLWPDRYLKGIKTLESVHELNYDNVRRLEPGTRYLPNYYREAANTYVPRPGKEAEIIQAFETVHPSESPYRFVTLHAEGGMGKTRMAVTCGKRMAGLFPQGVWFVSLAEVIRDRQAVAESIASALKLPTKTEAYLRQYVSQSRGILLILDNIESVACENVIDLIEAMLDDAPDLRLLATGREKLGYTHIEKEISLHDGMTPAEAQQLFLERVRLSGKPAPALDDPALPGLLELTAYIPLAIELLAAWWNTYGTVAEMAADYGGLALGPLSGDPTRSSRTDNPSAKQRQLSLTDSLNWSWRKLGQVEDGPEAQRLFAAISLFAAPFTAEAASIISQQSPIRPFLDRLLRASLIRLETGSNPTRYSVHRFTREYGQSQLSSQPDAVELRQQFVNYYVQLVAKNNNLNDATCRDILTVEWQNVIGAVDAAENIQDWQSILRLSDLGQFLNLRGMWAEQERLCKYALTAAQAATDKHKEGAALNNQGLAYESQGRWKDAEKSFQQSLTICKEFGDVYGIGAALHNLGVVYQSQEQWSNAENMYQQGLIICKALRDKHGEGQTLNNLGSIYQSQGRWNEAEQLYQESLIICQALGGTYEEGKTLNNLGLVYQKQRRWNDAEKCYQQSLTIKRTLKDRYGEGMTLANLAWLMSYQSKWHEALMFAQQAVTAFGQTDDVTMLTRITELVVILEQALEQS